MKAFFSILIAFLVIGCSPQAEVQKPTQEVTAASDWEAWKSQRLLDLNAKDGWNNLVGLYWLDLGENAFSSTVNPFDFATSVDYQASFLRGLNDQVFLTLRTETVQVKDSLIFDPESTIASEIAFDSVSFHLIQRDDKVGIRMREFGRFSTIDSIPMFEYDQNWEIEAQFVPHESVKMIPFQNVLGMTLSYASPGAIAFVKGGMVYSLDVIESGDYHFVIFSDQTSAVSTYGAGRYLYVPKKQEGVFTIDFNRSQNPPCAFTAFATCLLPPEQNFLPFSVEVGEKDYH